MPVTIPRPDPLGRFPVARALRDADAPEPSVAAAAAAVLAAEVRRLYRVLDDMGVEVACDDRADGDGPPCAHARCELIRTAREARRAAP